VVANVLCKHLTLDDDYSPPGYLKLRHDEGRHVARLCQVWVVGERETVLGEILDALYGIHVGIMLENIITHLENYDHLQIIAICLAVIHEFCDKGDYEYSSNNFFNIRLGRLNVVTVRHLTCPWHCISIVYISSYIYQCQIQIVPWQTFNQVNMAGLTDLL